MNNQNEEKKTVVEIHTMNAEEQERLETSIERLPEREQQLLTLRYGLNGEEKKTQNHF